MNVRPEVPSLVGVQLTLVGVRLTLVGVRLTLARVSESEH